MLLYEDHESIITAIAFSPDGSFLATVARDGSAVVRDSLGNANPLWPPRPKPVPILGLSFLADGKLIVGHESGWEVLTHDGEAWPLASRTEQLKVTALAPLSVDMLAYGTGDRLSSASGMFLLFDLKSKRSIQPTFREPFGVRAVATCPAKKIVAWATGNKELKIWDVRKQTPVSLRCSHTSPSLSLAPDGTAVAAVQDWAVRVYDLDGKQDRMPLKGHKGLVSCVAFSPDGSTVATGSWDGTVRFWDPVSGAERAVFQWPIGKVFSLQFAQDGLRVAAGGERGAVVVWDVE